MELFDTHAHLNDEQFEPIIAEVVERNLQGFVLNTLVVGCTLADSLRAIELAKAFPSLHASVGIQPNYVSEAQPDDFDQIQQLAKESSVIAIGETGLDRYWDRAPFDLQQEYFAKHIQLSIELGKPFIVHMRECEQDILDFLEDFRSAAPLQGIMHSFAGELKTAEKCMELGLHISFAGMVTYKKSDELRRVAASIPMDRLLIETDSPYLSPHPKRGHRPNEPSLVIHTAECLAEQHKVSVQELAEVTSQNAKELFGL